MIPHDSVDPAAKRVELAMVEAQPGGEAFVLGLVGADRQLMRLELPCWAAQQLMRVLPRLNAALAQARGEPLVGLDEVGESRPISRVRSARHAR